MRLKTKPAIGYVQLYFKIIGQKETYYSCLDGDFGKPLTQFRLYEMKKSMKKIYKKLDKIYSVEFCSKEEWEQNYREV